MCDHLRLNESMFQISVFQEGLHKMYLGGTRQDNATESYPIQYRVSRSTSQVKLLQYILSIKNVTNLVKNVKIGNMPGIG